MQIIRQVRRMILDAFLDSLRCPVKLMLSVCLAVMTKDPGLQRE